MTLNPVTPLAANLETEFDVSPFKNRLLKNAKHWQKWAKRMDTEAWRVYDKDVPQFPFAIDVYKDFVHLQEFDTGWQQSDEDYEGWICAVKIAIQRSLSCRRPSDTASTFSCVASPIAFEIRASQWRGGVQSSLI